MSAKILILCTGNSCRSRMAEGWLQSFDPSLEVHSAGTHPAREVHPMAIRVMREAGIDIRGNRPRGIEEFLNRPFDHVSTVCDAARETCPVFTGRVGARHHIAFRDPALARGSEEEVLREFRAVRDQIREGFRAFHDREIRRA
jgi:arsenate reductase